MIPDETPLDSSDFGRGHNQPPGLLPLELAVAELKEFIAERPQGMEGKTFQQRKEEILKSCKNAVIRTRADVGAAGDLIKIASKVWKKLEEARFDRSQPYRDTADALGRAAENFWDEVTEALSDLHGRIKVWTDAEDQRIEEQRLEQEREMERLRQAAAPPAPELPLLEDAPAQLAPAPATTAPAPSPVKRRKIRGDLGAIVSTVDKDTFTVSDVRALPDYVLNAPGVHDAIISVVRSTKKTLGVPPGITVTTHQDNQVR